MLSNVLRAITKIFHPEQWFGDIDQVFPQSPYHTRELAVFWWVGCFLRVRSAEQLEDWIRRGKLRRFGVSQPNADTLRRHLAAVPGEIWHEMARKLSRNRAWDRVAERHVVALDEVELFRSHSATCEECLTRKVKGVQEWFHRVVVASVVGGRRPLVLEFETVKPADGLEKNEGEQTAAYRLLVLSGVNT